MGVPTSIYRVTPPKKPRKSEVFFGGGCRLAGADRVIRWVSPAWVYWCLLIRNTGVCKIKGPYTYGPVYIRARVPPLLTSIFDGFFIKNHEKSIYRDLGMICIFSAVKFHEDSTSQRVCRWSVALC